MNMWPGTQDVRLNSPPVANSVSSSSAAQVQDGDGQRLTVKNTFLHIVDRDDPHHDDQRVMTRIYSAPTPECNSLSTKKLRSDEPVKVTRIGGIASTAVLEGEEWNGTSCLLEEADGSSVACSWSTRTKSGESPAILPEGANAPTTEPLQFGRCSATEQEIADVVNAEVGKEPTPPSDSLCAIQKMFNTMGFAANHELTIKNSFLHFEEEEYDERDRVMQRYASAPDALNSRVMPPKVRVLPPLSEELTAEEAEDDTMPPMHSPNTPPGVTADLHPTFGELETLEKIAEDIAPSNTKVEMPRPWETYTLVAVPTSTNRGRPAPGTKFLCTFVIGIRDCGQFAVSRRVIGPGGDNMKFISTLCSGTKLRLRGRGSGFRERDTNAESDVSLQINISSPYVEEYELAKRELSSLLTAIYRDYKRLRGKNVRLKIIEHPKNPKM
eukprot:GEMP01021763.1.p1 GENE.GEMP01021763.1~~GEMP01021763.1.p1  ORF type:complete len:440 (+),score=83.88 GEMP01021763.1:143-1462(+)